MTDQLIRTGIGIIADRTLVRQRLRETLEEKGFTVAVNIPPEGCSSSLLESPLVRVWVIDLNDEDGHDDLIDQLVDIPKVPVFFDMGLPDSSVTGDFFRWKRRLIYKLDEFRDPEPEHDTTETVVSWPLKNVRKKSSNAHRPQAERVWVLGASLGGPNAVKQFLDTLPEGLPVAFVYAQHIDQEFISVLESTVARHSYFEVVEAKPGVVLKEGEILLTPVERKINFDGRHRLHLLDQSWSGVYSPNIDEVMDVVRGSWPHTCGTIIFSGMGKDGSFEAQVYDRHDRPVWVQSPEDCASSLMPQSVIDAGCKVWSGTPQELAEHLVTTIKAEQICEQATS